LAGTAKHGGWFSRRGFAPGVPGARAIDRYVGLQGYQLFLFMSGSPLPVNRSALLGAVLFFGEKQGVL
jgi:hypothetical protein